MRQEAVDRRIGPDEQTTGNVPPFGNGKRQRFCSEFLPDPGNVLFVFPSIIGTGTVNQDSSRFQTRPDVGDNPALALPADFHVFRAPLFYGTGIFTKHPFTRTGHISQYDIEEGTDPRKIRRVIIGNHNIGMSPFRQILC